MSETKTKTINGVSYEISQPYAEGHTLTAIEAKVLNQTRSENIGNQLRKTLTEMAAEGKSEKEMAAVVAERDEVYEFNVRTVSGARKLDPYEREALKIAREVLKDHLAQDGRKLTVPPEGVSEEEWKDKVAAESERIAETEQVVKLAKKRVDARKKEADSLANAMEATSL